MHIAGEYDSYHKSRVRLLIFQEFLTPCSPTACQKVKIFSFPFHSNRSLSSILSLFQLQTASYITECLFTSLDNAFVHRSSTFRGLCADMGRITSWRRLFSISNFSWNPCRSWATSFFSREEGTIRTSQVRTDKIFSTNPVLLTISA